MKSQPIPLAVLQKRFTRVLFEKNNGVDPTWINVSETPRFSPKQRLDLYIQDYWVRMRESLEDDFPRLRKYLGRGGFIELIETFLQKRPCLSHELYDAGLDLPRFLATETPWCHRPFLGELARFEWTLYEADWELEAPRFEMANLAGLSPEQVDSVVLVFSPWVRLLESVYALDRDPKEEKPERSPVRWIFYRREEEMKTKRLRPGPWALLQGISQGTSLGGLFALLQENKISPAQGLRWLSNWASEGFFSHLGLSPNK